MAQNALVYHKKAAKDDQNLFGNGWELDLKHNFVDSATSKLLVPLVLITRSTNPLVYAALSSSNKKEISVYCGLT